MTVDLARRQRERELDDLSFDDGRGLFADGQLAGQALPLNLELEHERLSGDGGALPSATPRIVGVLSSSEHEREDRCSLREREVARRERMSSRGKNCNRRERQSLLHCRLL